MLKNNNNITKTGDRHDQHVVKKTLKKQNLNFKCSVVLKKKLGIHCFVLWGGVSAEVAREETQMQRSPAVTQGIPYVPNTLRWN